MKQKSLTNCKNCAGPLGEAIDGRCSYCGTYYPELAPKEKAREPAMRMDAYMAGLYESHLAQDYQRQVALAKQWKLQQQSLGNTLLGWIGLY